jgi:ketosteroid isomerase-like protein
MSETKADLARRELEIWNAGDVDRLPDLVTSDVEFVPMNAAVVGGAVRGPEEMARYRRSMEDTWESFRIEPQEFREMGERVLMRGRIVAKGRGSGVELDQPMAGVFWFREGRISRIESFFDFDKAVEAAAGRAP